MVRLSFLSPVLTPFILYDGLLAKGKQRELDHKSVIIINDNV